MRECKKYSLKISRDEIEKLKKFVQDTILLLENLPHHEIEVTLDEFRVQEQKKHLKSNEKDSFGCQKSSKTAPNRPKKDQISPQKKSLFIIIFSQILQKLILKSSQIKFDCFFLDKYFC